MTKSPNRKDAGQNIHVAQAAAGVLVLIGGAVAVFGLPGRPSTTKPPAHVTLPPVEVAAAHAPADATMIPVDFRGVSERMGLVGNAPKSPDVPAVETTAAAPPTLPPVAPPALRYVGPVIIGTSSLALVNEDGRQHFVRVGDVLADGRRVKAITPSELTLEGPGGESVVELTPRNGTLLTHASTGLHTPGMNSGMQAGTVPGMQSGMPNVHTTAMGPNGRPNPSAFNANGSRPDGYNGAGSKPSMAARGLMKNSKGAKGGANDPITERFQEIREKIKASGEYKSDADIDTAAKKMLESEGVGKGGPK